MFLIKVKQIHFLISNKKLYEYEHLLSEFLKDSVFLLFVIQN